jgi:hypothetical protein
MYDTPFRSYDAQLGRFHQIDPLADLAPGINPYRFGFNNPISLNDPTGLYEGSIQDIFDEAWARTSGDVGYFTFNNGSLNRDTSTENDINWVVDFVTSGQGTAEFMMNSGGGGFWLHYNPSFVGGYVGSRNEHVGAIIQKRSLFFRLGQQSGGGDSEFDPDLVDYLALGIGAGGAYFGGTGDAFYSSRHWVQGSGKVRLTSSAGNNFILNRSKDITRLATKNARAFSRGLGIAGSLVSAGQFLYEPTYANGFDVIMGLTAFILVAGWAIPGTYFISNIITTAVTGQTIGEHIFGNTTVYGGG